MNPESPIYAPTILHCKGTASPKYRNGQYRQMVSDKSNCMLREIWPPNLMYDTVATPPNGLEVCEKKI